MMNTIYALLAHSWSGLVIGALVAGLGWLIVRAPKQRNLDFAIQRSFHIIKESNLLFRAEFFNLTNTPNFGAPNT